MDDDIIRMARDAGLVREWMELCEKDEEALARFAALVVAAEREACAKVCEDYDDDRGTGETWGPRFAAIIRARGHQPPATVADRLARHGIPMPGDNLT